MPPSAPHASPKSPQFPSSSPASRQMRRARVRKGGKAPKDPTAGLQVANPNAAAIDIGGAEHWVSVPEGRCAESTRAFGCCTAELHRLADWLVECQVETVVMEATSNYWVVLYDILEERELKPIVVNPRYAKNMSGKKGDIPDAQWMQKLHTYGLFANSFRPPQEIRVLRTYLRQREQLVGSASEQIQHMQNALTEMNVQLANVISDISGETGLTIIDAILGGERDPQRLARLKDRGIVAGVETLVQALEGHWKDEEVFRLRQARLSYMHFQSQIQECQGCMERQMKAIQGRLPAEPVATVEVRESAQGVAEPKAGRASGPGGLMGEELQRILGVDLTQVDGIGPVAAQVILSEVGSDMSPWRSEKHFASWLGLCPDHRISGGKILGRGTRPVVSRVRHTLRMCAYTLVHSKSWLGAKYRRLRHRLGTPKAIVAMAHHLARLVYRLIRCGQPYVDKGMAAYEAKYREQRIQWIKNQAKELNLEVTASQAVSA
jgi:transposase